MLVGGAVQSRGGADGSSVLNTGGLDGGTRFNAWPSLNFQDSASSPLALWRPQLREGSPPGSPQLWKPGIKFQQDRYCKPTRTNQDLYGLYGTSDCSNDLSLKDIVEKVSGHVHSKQLDSSVESIKEAQSQPPQASSKEPGTHIHRPSLEKLVVGSNRQKKSDGPANYVGISKPSTGDVTSIKLREPPAARYKKISPKLTRSESSRDSENPFESRGCFDGFAAPERGSSLGSSERCPPARNPGRPASQSAAAAFREPKGASVAAPPLRVYPTNDCSKCSSDIFFFETQCLVCGRFYCCRCVKQAMGSMPEGRKCSKSCVGRPINRKYMSKAGRGCWPFGINSAAKEAELDYVGRRSARIGRESSWSESVWSVLPRSTPISIILDPELL